jgi:hypothetical protein
VTTPDEALVARWRRLEASINPVRAAVDSPDPHQCPDAVAVALNDLYDLWELWARKTRLTFKDQDSAIRGDTCGEVTAALVHARGGKSHVFVEFGNFTNTYSNTYFSHYASWRWQSFSDPTPRYADRDAWYARHIAQREVLPAFDCALQWLRQQPQLV